jgi:hypothetical protein
MILLFSCGPATAGLLLTQTLAPYGASLKKDIYDIIIKKPDYFQ